MYIDAVARTPARLELSAVDATLSQSSPDERVSARFRLRLLDNYGADDRLTATAALQVVSSDGQTPVFPSGVALSDGIEEFEVSIAPRAGADAALTVTASLAGVADATAFADITAAAAPRPTTLLLDGSPTPPTRMLAQTRPRQPVAATFMLTALDQYGAAIGVGAVTARTSTANGVVVAVQKHLAADGLSATLTVSITPNDDADARVRLVVGDGDASVATLIEVDAADRAPARLRFEPVSATLTQSVPEEAVRARFRLTLIDNYGDDDELPATDVRLDATSSDGQAVMFFPLFSVPPGGAEVSALLTPDGADATLALRASLDGVADAVARADIRHAAARRLAALLWNIERPPGEPRARLHAARAQSLPQQAVFLRVRLRGEDQYGDDYSVGEARISTTATANAAVSLTPLPLTLLPVWNLGVVARDGFDTVATLVAAAGDISAVVTVAVAAAPRELSNLQVTALDATLNQRRLGALVTATFSVRLVDNYGDDDRLAPMTVTMLAFSSDGQALMFPSTLSVPRGGALVNVLIRPMIADTSLLLTLAASLPGLNEASAVTRIFAATTPALASLLLDGSAATLTRSVTPPTAGAPAVVRLRLSGRDQYDDAFNIGAGLNAGTVRIETYSLAGGGSVEITRTLSPDDLSAMLNIAITPDEDEDARVGVRVSGENGALVAAIIEVDAIARALHSVSIASISSTPNLLQHEPGESLTARFRVRVLDNYGRDDVLAAPEVMLSAATDDGRTLTPRPRLLTPPAGGAEVEVSIEPMRARTTLTLSGDAVGVVGGSAQVLIMRRSRLQSLLLNGEASLSLSRSQSELRRPVSTTLRLTAADQFGAAFSPADAALTISADNNARAEFATHEDSPLRRTLTLVITPDEDADATVTLTATLNGVSAAAVIAVDAVDRVPVNLTLSPVAAELTQNMPGEAVVTRFGLRVSDNYGDDDATTTTVTLAAFSSDVSSTPIFPSEFLAPIGGGRPIEVSVTPAAGIDTTLTLRVSAAGVEASASVRVLAAAPTMSFTLDVTLDDSVNQKDCIVLGTLLEDPERHRRAYDAAGGLINAAARAEIVAALAAQGLPIFAPLSEVVDFSALMVVRTLNDGGGLALDVDASGIVDYNDIRFISSMLGNRHALSYAYDAQGARPIPSRTFIVDIVTNRLRRVSAPFPEGREREILERIYLRLFHPSSSYSGH